MATRQHTSKVTPTIAITGASGFVGWELVTYFHQKGWRVVALVRNSAKHAKNALAPAIEYREYDLVKPLQKDTLKGVDYLVHAAYIKHDSQHPDTFEQNVKAATALVHGARQANVKHLVFMSSMSAHDSAESVYGKQKLAIEKLFSGTNAAAIRSGLIVGNGGIVKKMFTFMKSKHLVPLIGGGKQPLQIIAVYDLARVIDVILRDRHSGLLTIASPTVYSYKAFYQAISRRFGIKIAFVPLPLWMLLSMVKTIGALRLPLAVNADSVLGLKHLRAADTAADLKKLGIHIDPLEKALEKTTMS